MKPLLLCPACHHPFGGSHRFCTCCGARLDPLAALERSIRGIGHPEFPFLDPVYSPGSRIPCRDFSGFMAECLQANDSQTVARLFRYLIAGNPGVGVSDDWGADWVQEVNALPLSQYVQTGNPIVIHEIKALLVLAGLGGGPRKFHITDGIPAHLARALSCHHLTWLPAMAELHERVNQFIRHMRREAPFWKEFPLIKAGRLLNFPLPESALRTLLENFSPSVRALALYFADDFRWSIPKSISYGDRRFGIHPEEAAAEIENTDLCEHADAPPGILLKAWEKDRFLQHCNNLGIEIKSSWSKSRLLEELLQRNPELIERSVRRESAVRLNPKYAEDMKRIKDHASFLEDHIKALIFL